MKPLTRDVSAGTSARLVSGLCLAAVPVVTVWVAERTGLPWYLSLWCVAAGVGMLWMVSRDARAEARVAGHASGVVRHEPVTDDWQETSRKELGLYAFFERHRPRDPLGVPTRPSDCCLVHFLHNTEVRTENRETQTVTYTCPECGYRARMAAADVLVVPDACSTTEPHRPTN
jgi:hypothetical protein